MNEIQNSKFIILKATELVKTYLSGQEKLEVLKGISLEVHKGEILAILGPSGSGKSTLLHLLSGLDRPNQGDVFLNSKKFSATNEKELAEVRNKNIGFVFQFHHLLPEFTVLENVAIPLLVSGVNPKAAMERARNSLTEVGLALSQWRSFPASLSGGEKQRVALARALVHNPLILFLDEPTGNLDSAATDGLLTLLDRLNREDGKTMLIVTHNERVAQLAKRRFYLKEGRLNETL